MKLLVVALLFSIGTQAQDIYVLLDVIKGVGTTYLNITWSPIGEETSVEKYYVRSDRHVVHTQLARGANVYQFIDKPPIWNRTVEYSIVVIYKDQEYGIVKAKTKYPL